MLIMMYQMDVDVFLFNQVVAYFSFFGIVTSYWDAVFLHFAFSGIKVFIQFHFISKV